MWNTFIGMLPSTLVIICTILAFLIPFSVYWINTQLHIHGDPPWKVKNQEDEKQDPQQNDP
ncbi:hypothetical protein [Paenibacillus sp. SI8]|uniref:hypothetical protein n=1 Tax=unclassified Paenibacillus TaxID=185978 RepID=UPI0034676C4B